MCDLTVPETIYAVTALAVQAVLCIHFAMRRWRPTVALRYGWVVYALAVPLAEVSVLMWLAGMGTAYWLGGVVYLAWAILGYIVEYALKIEWRSPIRWPVFVPYVILFLATMMLYWWPLWPLCRPLWAAAAALYVAGTVLNVTSHQAAEGTPA
jgi:hypothetical protein